MGRVRCPPILKCCARREPAPRQLPIAPTPIAERPGYRVGSGIEGKGPGRPSPRSVQLRGADKKARGYGKPPTGSADAWHKLTADLTRRFHTIVIEDWNVGGLRKNHHLARSMADMRFFEFRRQLEYQAERRGDLVVVADRWVPSSQTCSACGTVQENMALALRPWTCPDCGILHDRDANAARNLLAYGLAALSGSTASAAECEAGGEASAGLKRKWKVKRGSVKQEISVGSV